MNFLLAVGVFISYLLTQLQSDEIPLIVGLGSWCHTATAVKKCGLRKAAYPFDWLAFPSHESLVKLLDEDFQFFTDEKLMIKVFDFPDSPNTLKNTYYNILFHHDTPHPYDNRTDQKSYEEHIEAIQNKYARRINRFRALRFYSGKVFFIRHPHWENPEEFKKNRQQAQELRDALFRYFPDLDFTLVIVNSTYQNTAPIENLERVIEYKINDFEILITILLKNDALSFSVFDSRL